jgi:signal transduction histidine kinase
VVQPLVDIRSLLHAILTCVTAGPGLGFNRAVMFLSDEESTELVAAMAVGPVNHVEARATWARLERERMTVDDLMRAHGQGEASGGLQRLVEGLTIPLGPTGDRDTRFDQRASAPGNPLLEAYTARRVVKITDAARLNGIPSRLRDIFAGTEVVCVPLVAKDRSVGLIVADNAFTREPIGQERVQLLQLLATVSGLALDNARISQHLERQREQLQETLDQLRATQEQLIHNERLATVGAVVARVSHEIRNPLTTIGGFARTLRAHPDDIERVARTTDIIVEEVEKLEALLKEMLDFTSPKSPALEPADIAPVITALANVHREDLAGRRIGLSLDLAPQLPRTLIDRNQMQRVFLNLWQNAVQAMEESPSDAPMVLSVRAWRDRNTVKVAFADTGVGISRDAMSRIFTPFFTTKRRGTGLGLAVVKKIVDDHHGSVEVQSERGAGTTFTIVLPITR